MYTEPVVNRIFTNGTQVASYGILLGKGQAGGRQEGGYQELQVWKESDGLALVLQSAECQRLLAYLPHNKLRWNTTSLVERQEAGRVRCLRAAQLLQARGSAGLDGEAYNITLNSLTSYYVRIAGSLQAQLNYLVVSGRARLAGDSVWKLDAQMAVFVMAKVQEHYMPARYDKPPRFRRDFCRVLKYRMESNVEYKGDELTAALVRGALAGESMPC